MKNKRIVFIVLFLFVVIVMASILISGGNEEPEDSSFYVEGNNNVFIKLANVCDDCCYYIVDLVLGGVESLFSAITGN